MKYAESLTTQDLEKHPVWEFINDDEIGESAVRPVEPLPADTLDGRLVGLQVQLANGGNIWGLLGNVSLQDTRLTEHTISLSLEKEGKWFAIPRYFDVEPSVGYAETVAAFLGLSVDDVFPITYDLSPYAVGDPSVLSGKILEEPQDKLSDEQILEMIINCHSPALPGEGSGEGN